MDKYAEMFHGVAATFKDILDKATSSEAGYLMILAPLNDLNNIDIMSSLSKEQMVEVLQNAIKQIEQK